jgi:hypothetical protein
MVNPISLTTMSATGGIFQQLLMVLRTTTGG